MAGLRARSAYTRSGRTFATVTTVVAVIRPSPMPMSRWAKAMVPARPVRLPPRSVVPPSQYWRTKPWDATTTLTSADTNAVTASPAGVRGSTRSRSAISRYAAAVPSSAMLVMLRPSIATPPSPKTSACTMSTTATQSAPTHGPTSSAASAPPSR